MLSQARYVTRGDAIFCLWQSDMLRIAKRDMFSFRERENGRTPEGAALVVWWSDFVRTKLPLVIAERKISRRYGYYVGGVKLC